jgi:methylglutaconyl-CoA hydratase
MTDPVLLVDIDRRGIATVTLNRPDVNNAYDGALIDALAQGLERLAATAGIRLVVLRGNGRHFQAGADLAFLRKLTAAPEAENLAFSRATVAAIDALASFPCPTLALVHGGCFGGGVGMVAACDMAVASDDAVFSLTEVRWGITPAPIIPVLVAAIGVRALGRYGLTAERFDAAEARRIGLLHAVCPAGGLDAAAAPIVDGILLAAPDAVAVTKRLVRQTAGLELGGLETPGLEKGAAFREHLAVEAATRRHSAEAKEGLASFAEKRKPGWYPGDPD